MKNLSLKKAMIGAILSLSLGSSQSYAMPLPAVAAAAATAAGFVVCAFTTTLGAVLCGSCGSGGSSGSGASQSGAGQWYIDGVTPSPGEIISMSKTGQ